jgi:hypothetical protein
MEALDWVKVAEDTGFDIAGIADSQSLYRDVYVVWWRQTPGKSVSDRA